MRRYLLAAVAAAAIATPAVARDGSPYVGIEGGIVLPEDLIFDVGVDSTSSSNRFDRAFTIDFKKGLDVDAIAGYDFGSFRLEGELGYKRLRVDGVRLDTAFASSIGVINNDFDISDRGSVISLMGNAMLDFGDDDGWSGFVGGGVGRARVKVPGDTDSSFAFQGIAGVRKAITPNIDVGLKYRYFRVSKLDFNDDFSNGGSVFGLNTRGKLTTHSLLASLIYNFAAPAPIVIAPVVIAPPPPPPATQTCYDGSVILATDICPQMPAPPPPPPPEPMPERG
ncbi:MAG: outer membrane beta-barrel protein [Pseudomonadota bacterium]|nr:outer membrane beta-barrel protein [Pseudomonadota bacterium]